MHNEESEMPRKALKEGTGRGRVPKELLDQLLSGCESSSDLTGPDGLLRELVGALVSRAMDVELAEHLGYEEGEAPPGGRTNRLTPDPSRPCLQCLLPTKYTTTQMVWA